MFHPKALEKRIQSLANHAHDGSAADAFLARLDNLLPRQSISINQFARTKRKMVNPGGEPFDFDPTLTPYMDGPSDALDHPDVRAVSVKGNTRCGKTVAAENMILRDWTYGSDENVLWFMQDRDSLNDYIDERGEEMLQIHPEVDERIDWTDRRNSRTRKRIGKSLILYRPATQRMLRGKAAPVIVADEIDAYDRRVRDAIVTMITSRQEEFGNTAKVFVCSHPDAGPDGGIDAVLRDSLLHLWHVRCTECGCVSSPAREAEDLGKPRLNWNVPDLMGQAEGMDRVAFLDMVAKEVALVCPECGTCYDPDKGRLKLMNAGRWLQPHQEWLKNGSVKGEPKVATNMGFVVHGFMAPFVKLRETAREWASGSLTARIGSDRLFREVVVKKLGETPQAAKPEEQIDSARVVQARLGSHYDLKTVPDWVDFLTAFVDIQGDRFEVVVIGWDIQRQSCLVDRYSIKQWPAFGKHDAFDNIDPGNRVTDFDVIEEAVICASYPLQSNPQRKAAGLPELFLPVARVSVNSAGQPGATNNARVWAANMLGRNDPGQRKIEQYRILLMQGAARKTGEAYPKPKQVTHDDAGKPLLTPVYERYPNVHDLKLMIAKRMKIEAPSPGRMYLPSNLPMRYVSELTSEQLQNGEWVKTRDRNETWDGWVACELTRASLEPDRTSLWEDASGNPRRPPWATPKPRGQGLESVVSAPSLPFDRLSKLNRGD